MTLAVAKAPACTTDVSSLSRLRELLAKTLAAYDLLNTRGAPTAMLQMIRHSLGQAHFKLAEACLSAGKIAEAIDSGRQANEFQPGDRDVSMLFARALLAANDMSAALPVLERAAALHGSDAGIHALLAQVYGNSGRAAEAVGAFRRAVLLQPADSTLTAAFAHALAVAGQIGESLAVYRQLLATAPDHFENLSRYAELCKYAGAFDEARTAFARLMHLQPGRGLNHRLFGQLHTYGQDDPHIAQMQALLAATAPNGDNAREFNFALFKAHEAIGDHRQAFQYLKSANDIRKMQLDYRPEIYNRLFETVEAAFCPEGRPRSEPFSRPESPIFIVGMPRSGSTLVEQILDSHPDVSAAGETPVFATLVEKYLLRNDLSFDLSLLATGRAIAAFGDAYLEAIGKTADTTRRTVDKYLTNFLSIGIIKMVFPKARIVYCQRNPLANCFSIYSCHFETTGLGFKADMAQTADYYVRYVRLMRFWKAQFGDQILDFSYEGLTHDQETETRRLIDYCGLEWDAACLNFHKNDRAVKTASFMQVRQPIYSGTDRRTHHYVEHLGPMIRILQEAGLHPG